MRKKLTGLCLLTLMIVMLSACGNVKLPEAITSTSIVVNSDGKINTYLVGTFDKDYYSISELTNMAVEEANAFNSENKTKETNPVSINNVYLNSNKDAVVEIFYDEDSSYRLYNENEFYYTTVDQAVSGGLVNASNLCSVSDESAVSVETLANNAKKHVIILEDQAIVYCPAKVLYLTKGVSYDSENKTVDTRAVEGSVQIILAK